MDGPGILFRNKNKKYEIHMSDQFAQNKPTYKSHREYHKIGSLVKTRCWGNQNKWVENFMVVKKPDGTICEIQNHISKNFGSMLMGGDENSEEEDEYDIEGYVEFQFD